MVKRIGSLIRKARHKLSQPKKQRGKIPLKRYFQEFSKGDVVNLALSPHEQKGRYHLRFHGAIGKIVSKQGKSYYVAFKDGNKKKQVLVSAVHLKRV